MACHQGSGIVLVVVLVLGIVRVIVLPFPSKTSKIGRTRTRTTTRTIVCPLCDIAQLDLFLLRKGITGRGGYETRPYEGKKDPRRGRSCACPLFPQQDLD